MVYELLRAENLVLDLGGTARINHMGFSIAEGESAGVVGLSGGGKTSLGKILCGELVPNEGRILRAGKVLSREQLAQMSVHISSEDRLLENLSVQETLMVLGSTREHHVFVPWKQVRQTAMELLKSFDLEAYLDRAVKEIPLPVQHRILMVNATVRGKRLVVLDHVADTYSVQEEHELSDCIRKLCRRGISVIYITGRLDTVLWDVDQVTVVRDGRRIKTLNHGTFTEATLRAHIYGYRVPTPEELRGVKNTYETAFELDGIPLPVCGLIPVLCGDSSAAQFFERMTKITGKNSVFLNSASLYEDWVEEFSPLDNLLLLTAQRVSGPGFHVPKQMRQLLCTECMESTGLSFEQMEQPLSWRNRMERFKLLYYRLIISHTDTYVLDRITSGADIQDWEEIRCISATLPGLVFYISGNYQELTSFGTQIYTLEKGQLRKESL